MKQNKLSYKVGQYLMFGGPGTLLFLAVVIVPFVYGLYLTFTSWDGVSATKELVGFQNFADAFTDGDYWVDDATSNYYNTLVHEDSFATRKGWLTGENMYELLRYYRYMVVIQYNTNPVIPGAGSAIFLHCQAGDTDTAGCVATTGATMFAIFRWLNPKSDPHILIY